MIAMTVGKIAELINGRLHNLQPDVLVNGAPVIDSRKAVPGSFFVAYAGEHVDGHDFAVSAIEHGAVFALTSKEVDVPSIIVGDVTEALSVLAAHVRRQLPGLVVIGITGSQGKTTTKDLLTHILEIAGPTVSPAGSLNNEIGVPLTLLRCDENTKFCVSEMGARHMGDIARLVEIARPNIGTVLVVGQAHLGEFGSRANIAKAKGELIRNLDKQAIAVLGTYDEFTPHMADGMPNRVIRFGEQSSCDVRAADVELREGRAHFDLVTPQGRVAVGLQLLGLHQIPNALAAAAIATALEIPIDTIAAALSNSEASSKWRMELHEEAGLLLINDAYNANPESMAAALRTLGLLAQERGGLSWAFLGQMHELGASSAHEHQKIGRLVSDIGIDHLVSVATDLYAEDAQGHEGHHRFVGETTLHRCSTFDGAVALVQHFSVGDVVLVKASRSEKFDELAERLLATWREANG